MVGVHHRENVSTMSRAIVRALILIVAILAVASVSIDCGRTFAMTDMRGAPVRGAYAAYHYEGTTFALVESVSYQASPLAVVQSDSTGQMVIPGAIHVHWPLVQTHPAVNVDLIYAPPLHNGLAWVSRLGAVSRPREF